MPVRSVPRTAGREPEPLRRTPPGSAARRRAARPPRRVSGPIGRNGRSEPDSDRRRAPLDPGAAHSPARACRERSPPRSRFRCRSARSRPANARSPSGSARSLSGIERRSRHTGIGRRIGAAVLSLPDHHLLDRVIRGRVWIPLLGVLLAGIVATQVEILKLGASMGRSLEQTSSLTSQNEQLRDNVAALSDDQRIERLATGDGHGAAAARGGGVPPRRLRR